MKRMLLPLFTAAFLFACGTPAENSADNEKDATHTEGDGHATEGHDEQDGHRHDDGHVHEEAAHDTTAGNSHDDGHTH